MERLGTGDFRIRVPFWVAERSIGTNRGVGNLATGGRAGRRAVAIARRDAVEIRAEIIISSRARVGGDEVRPRVGGALDGVTARVGENKIRRHARAESVVTLATRRDATDGDALGENAPRPLPLSCPCFRRCRPCPWSFGGDGRSARCAKSNAARPAQLTRVYPTRYRTCVMCHPGARCWRSTAFENCEDGPGSLTCDTATQNIRVVSLAPKPRKAQRLSGPPRTPRGHTTTRARRPRASAAFAHVESRPPCVPRRASCVSRPR